MNWKDYTLIETTLTNVADDLQELSELVDTSENEEWSKDLENAWKLIEELRASQIYCFEINEEGEE